MGAGTLTLTSDLLSLGAGPGAIAGTGTVILQPSSAAQTMVLGAAGAAGQFSLTQAGLDVLAPGFAAVDLGRADGADPITVDAVSFANPTTLLSPQAGGQITFAGAVTTSQPGASLTADSGGTLTVLANLTLAPAASLVLDGDTLVVGTAGARVDLLAASGGITLDGPNAGSTVTIGNDYTTIKAGGALVIGGATLAATPGATIALDGLLQSTTSVTINSNQNVTGANARINSLGSITIVAVGDISLASGLVTSAGGTLTLTADADHTGAGQLLVGTGANALVSAQNTATLSGENVLVGGATAFGRVLSFAGDLVILANLNQDGAGGFTLNNSASLLSAGRDLLVGQTGDGLGTPGSISFLAGTLSAGQQFNAFAVDGLTAGAGFTATAGGDVEFATPGSLTLTGATITSNGTLLALLADADFDHVGNALLTGAAVLNVPAGTFQLNGNTLSVNPSVKILAKYQELDPGL
jgi:hypothetical protein